MLSEEDVKKLDDKVKLLYSPIYIYIRAVAGAIKREHEMREIDNTNYRIKKLFDEYKKKNSD